MTTIPPPPPQSVPINFSKTRVWKTDCAACNLHFPTGNDYANHLVQVHNDPFQWSCRKCGKSGWQSRSQFLRHIQIVHGTRLGRIAKGLRIDGSEVSIQPEIDDVIVPQTMRDQAREIAKTAIAEVIGEKLAGYDITQEVQARRAAEDMPVILPDANPDRNTVQEGQEDQEDEEEKPVQNSVPSSEEDDSEDEDSEESTPEDNHPKGRFPFRSRRDPESGSQEPPQNPPPTANSGNPLDDDSNNVPFPGIAVSLDEEPDRPVVTKEEREASAVRQSKATIVITDEGLQVKLGDITISSKTLMLFQYARDRWGMYDGPANVAIARFMNDCVEALFQREGIEPVIFRRVRQNGQEESTVAVRK